MKKSILVLTLALQTAAISYTAPVYAQDGGSDRAAAANEHKDANSTGEKSKGWNAGRAVGHVFGEIGHGFEWLGRSLFHWGHVGSKWIAHEVVQGADAAWDGSKWLAHKTVDGSKWLAGETKDLARYGACLSVKGAKITWRNSQKVGRVVGRNVKEGTIFMVEETEEFGRGTQNADSKTAENKADREARKKARQAAAEEPSKLPSCASILKDDDSKPETKVADGHAADTKVADDKKSKETIYISQFDLSVQQPAADLVQRSPAVTDIQAKAVDTSSATLLDTPFDFGQGGCFDGDTAL